MELRSITKQIICCVIGLASCFYASIIIAGTEKLLGFAYMGEFTRDNAKLTLKSIPQLDSLEPRYSTKLYKIYYKTTAPDGGRTIASGLVVMPILQKNKASIVSFHHGTRVARNDVPSAFNEGTYVYPAIFSNSGGYMLVMADYLGLGDNALPLHPYVQSETLASSSIDMLIAAKELAANLNYPINDKLFLAGYSEGGFTTMVTYEALLKDHKEISVTAVAPGSAPYDWNETMGFIIKNPGPRASLYLAYFFYSMQTYHHYWSGLDVLFKKPYDTLVPTLFDGMHGFDEVLAALPDGPYQLMQDEFFDSIVKGTNPHIQELITNFNHYNFKSTSPLLLIGTKGDHDLPYHGAEIAYQSLKKQSDEVYIKSVSDVLDHIQAAPFVLLGQLEFFKQY
jgi:hypothetical protein